MQKVDLELIGRLSLVWNDILGRVSRGSVDTDKLLDALNILELGYACAGVRFRPDYGGMTISISRGHLELFEAVIGANGSEVKRVIFSDGKLVSAVEEGRDILQEKGLRLATLPEALAYVHAKVPKRAYRQHGLIRMPVKDSENLNVSFEEVGGQIVVHAARLNWQYLSNWKNPIPFLAVKL